MKNAGTPSTRRALLAAALGLAALAAQAQLKPPAPSGAGRGVSPPAAPAAPAPAAAPAASADAEKETAGKLAAQAWLQLLDRKDWGTAWESASTGFKQTVPLGTWMDNIPKVRDPLGPLKEREAGTPQYRTGLPGRPPGHYVSIAFTSTFDKGQVSEVVTTALDADGRFRVLGYSPAPR